MIAAAAWAVLATAEEPLVTASVLTSHSVIAPGGRLSIGIRFAIQPGWHIYWINPGDSGLPTTVSWQEDARASIGPLFYPVPKAFESQGAAAYGYEGEATLLASHTARRVKSSYSFSAEASWLACKEACIPGSVELRVPVVVGSAAQPSPDAQALEELRQALPSAFPGRLAATRASGAIELTADSLRTALSPSSARFLPSRSETISHSAPHRLESSGSGFRLSMPISEYASKPPATLDGILVLQTAAGERAFRINQLPISSGR